MEESLKIAYSEIFEILKYLDKTLINKIPNELIEYFENNRIHDYKTRIDKTDIFNKNNISRQTLSILAYLNLNYWVDKNKKEHLKKIYRKNEFEYSEKLKDQYPIDVFKDNKNINKTDLSDEKALIEYQPGNIFVRIINILKNVLFKKRNRD